MANIEILFAGVLDGHKDSIYAMVSGPTPDVFFSAGGDGLIVRWDLQHKNEGTVIAQLPVAVYSLLYIRETNTLLAGCRYGGLYILDLTAQKQEKHVELKGDVFDLCLLNASGTIAAVCAGGYLTIISGTNYAIQQEIHPTSRHARTLSLNQNADLLASGWSDGMVRIYDTVDLTEQAVFPANAPSVFALLFNSIDGALISGGRDALLKVWDTQQGFALQKTISGHMYTVNHLIPIPELGLFASASRDKTVKIWDARTYELLKVIDRPKLPAHSHSVNRLLWPGFGNYLLSAGDDKTIKVWGIICG